MGTSRTVFHTVVCSVTFWALGAPAFSADKPPPAPLKPVVETLFGRAVTDNYRYMEAMGPETLDWMKAEGSYTRSVFDSIAPLGKLKSDVAAFTGSFGLTQGYVRFGSR